MVAVAMLSHAELEDWTWCSVVLCSRIKDEIPYLALLVWSEMSQFPGSIVSMSRSDPVRYRIGSDCATYGVKCGEVA